jgi:hypothetical protein
VNPVEPVLSRLEGVELPDLTDDSLKEVIVDQAWHPKGLGYQVSYQVARLGFGSRPAVGQSAW